MSHSASARNRRTHLQRRERKVQLPVEAARPAQRGVYHVDPVCRADDEHFRLGVESVHEREESADDARVDLLRLRSSRYEAVDFVEEYNGRPRVVRLKTGSNSLNGEKTEKET